MNGQFVYIQSERAGQKISEGNYFEHNLYTVGFYRPDGTWEPESDWPTREKAAERVHYLNGGKPHIEKLTDDCLPPKDVLASLGFETID